MDRGKKITRAVLMYLIPFLCAALLNLTDGNPIRLSVWNSGFFSLIHNGVLASLLIEGVYILWVFSIRRRFPQKQMRGNATLFAAAFILLSLLSCVKYSFAAHGSAAARYLWYAYYTPLTFGPLFMVHASMYFGKPDDHRLPKKWRWTYLPAAMLSLGILTNDLHQLAFVFPSGLENWEVDYSHGILYYLAFLWGALGLVTVIALAIRSTFSRRLFRTAWLPLAVLMVMAVYPVLYGASDGKLRLIQDIFEMNDFICISCIALWESFVAARIIVSNSDYPAIFAASSLNAGLADGEWNVRQVSARGVLPQPEDLKKARSGETLLPDGDTLLKARAVTGGWFYWTEDVTELRRLQGELNDTAEYLEEENAMLRVSAQIEEGRRKTAEQTKLYDRVTEVIRPQLDALDRLLRDLPPEEDAFRERMKTAGILIAYVKRRSSLLLAGADKTFTGAELGLCFEESARALRMAGIPCEIAVDREALLPAQTADLLYEIFETAAERALPALRSVRVAITAQPENRIAAAFTLDGACEPLTEPELADLRMLFSDVSLSRGGGAATLQIAVNPAQLTRAARDTKEAAV
ncbi:MAG: hypothetical protein IJL25_13015 [Clostridia bacterium]|nr:hypothetical protein [Clostridia bacterium]MBR5424100.1 hypothetical protein [Clostridia bacterium]